MRPELRHLAAALLCCASNALAETPSDAVAEIVFAECRAALADNDHGRLRDILGIIDGWGEVEDPAVAAGIKFCKAMAVPALENARDVTNAPEAPTEEPVDPRLARYLEDLTTDGADVASIVATIAEDERFAPPAGAARDQIEDILLAHVRPIPAAQAADNLTAYRALQRVDPQSETYASKVEHYRGALHATGRRVAKSLIKRKAEFDGSSWSRHPSSPRYQDTRSYVTLYILEDAKGRRKPELFLNYTADDGWLFVESASINIDGDVVRFPATRWFRDNDTEIWEWAGVEGEKALDLAERIGSAKRAVVRFNGMQFYDDLVISSSDRKVLREMLAAWYYLEAD